MVKTFTKIIFISLLSGVFCFLSACNVDLFGLFLSSDLDERHAERDNFKFLNSAQRNLNFGNDYSFIVVTDTHIENGNAFGLEGLESVISSNNANHGNSQIKFVVNLGDITQYGAAKDLNVFINFSKSLSIPCYPVIGNHDIYNGNWIVWKDYIGSTRYKIDGGGTTLFILDSANAFFGKEQLDWLERELKHTSGHVFVFTHTNLFVSNLLNIQHLSDKNERARITYILKDKCDIMFMGHSHERWEHVAGGVKYVNIEDFKDTKVYCLVSVTSTGVSYEFKKL